MWEKVTDDANKIGRVSAIRDFQSLTKKIFFCDRGFLNRAMQHQFPLGEKFVSATWFSSTNAKETKKKKTSLEEKYFHRDVDGAITGLLPFLKGRDPQKKGPRVWKKCVKSWQEPKNNKNRFIAQQFELQQSSLMKQV